MLGIVRYIVRVVMVMILLMMGVKVGGLNILWVFRIVMNIDERL